MDHTVEQYGTTLGDRIRHVVEEVIQGTPLFLVDLEVRGRKGSQVVDVFIDSDEALGVDELARVSREVGFLLDTGDVMPGGYSLNVSSPGVSRPLALPRQFKKNVGRTLKVKYAGRETEGTITATGELTRADDEGIEITSSVGAPVQIPYGDVREAKVLLPW